MVTVRDAMLNDADDIAALHIASWRATYAHAFPADYLAGLDRDAWAANHRRQIESSPPRISLVAVAGADESAGQTAAADHTDPETDTDRSADQKTSKIIGVINAGPRRVGRPPAYDPKRGEVYMIYVHPDALGTGAGLALMRAAVGRLAATGRHEINVWVLDDNPRARRFYERFGFTLSGATDDFTISPAGPHETTVTEIEYELTVG